MKTRNLRGTFLPQFAIIALLAGCNGGGKPAANKEEPSPSAIQKEDEIRRVAEAALGQNSEVIAHGDLARNGMEELLVIHRFANTAGSKIDSPAIFVARAAVLERRNDKWAELLRCDEHLKNTNGYLGGSPSSRVSGWKIEFTTDTKRGLEIKFTPADGMAGTDGAGQGGSAHRSIVVRWNAAAKRYQSVDVSNERYLSEAPALEVPQSILR